MFVVVETNNPAQGIQLNDGFLNVKNAFYFNKWYGIQSLLLEQPEKRIITLRLESNSMKLFNNLVFHKIRWIHGIVRMEISVIMKFEKRNYRYDTTIKNVSA